LHPIFRRHRRREARQPFATLNAPMDRVPDPAAFDAVARHGAPAFAWEVLRRNRAYRTAARTLLKFAQANVSADADFVATWGLHFR
jgi:hypothetical protein